MKCYLKPKALLLLLIFCIFTLSFVACDRTSTITVGDKTTNIPSKTSTISTKGTTVETTVETTKSTETTTTEETITNKIIDQDIYDELLIYYNRMEKIINRDIDANQLSFRREYIVDRVYEYTREELLENYRTMEFEYNYSEYFDVLDEAFYFIQRIIKSIDNELGECIGQKYYPNPKDLKEFYQFSMDENNSLVIKGHKYNSKYYVKLGFEEELLTYKFIQYYYDLNSDLTNLEDSLEYRYYEFKENVECMKVYSFTYQKMISYESLENEEAYSILYDGSIINGETTGEYNLHGVDVSNQVIYDLRISKDLEIIGENYGVFTDLGCLYNYSDYDVTDDEVSITTNFIEATGWDYLVTTKYTNDDGITKEAGIYKGDGASLYSGNIPCSNTDEYVITQLTRSISNSQVTDSELNLSNYGMYLDNEKATVSYLDSIKVENILDVKQDYIIKGINLFEENRSLSLYDYLDDDIKLVITGETNTTIETTGDIDALLTAISSFEATNLESNEVVYSTIKKIIFKEQEYVNEITDYYSTLIDYDDMYYQVSNHGSNVKTESIILKSYHDNLVEFNSDGNTMKCSIFAKDNLEYYFTEYVTSMVSKERDVLSSLINVEKIDDFNYHLVIDKSYFGQGINMNDLFFQQGYSGFNDAVFTGTLNFSEDFSEYKLILSLTGLNLLENPEVKVSREMTVTTSYNEFDFEDPLSMNIYVYLPTNKSDIVFDRVADISYKVFATEKQSNWLKFYLEAGHYNPYIGNDYTVYDALGNMVEVYDYLIIEEAGTYYIELNTDSSYTDSIHVTKIADREMVTICLDDFQENIDVTLEEGDIDYYILSSTYSNDVIIRFDFPQLEGSTRLTLHTDQFSNGGTWGKTFYGDAMSMYYYLPANETIRLKLSGDFLGTIQLNYEVIQSPQSQEDIPDQTLDSTYIIEDIILTPSASTARINFTVTESDYYKISYECYRFDFTDLVVDLYSENGDLISTDSGQKLLLLEPGEYYYIFHYREGIELNPIVIIADFRKGR